MEVKSYKLSYYVKRVNSGKPFSFIRIGDGEWTASMLHDRKRTGSGSHTLSIPEMNARMRDMLLKPVLADNYILSTRPTALKPAIKRWADRHMPHTHWHDCRIFYRMSMHGRLYPYIKAIRSTGLPVLVIGPAWLSKLSRILPVGMHVKIPKRDCYYQYKRILKQAKGYGRKCFVTVSAGPPGKLLVHDLYEHMGDRCFIMDHGSLWDVYCGRRTRRYHKKMTKDIIRRNVKGE